MKRKKKDLNQHSWKVHILQFLTVGFALWSWWETAAGVKLTQKLPQDQTERWMAVLLITGFLGSVWLGTMLVKRKKLLLCISAVFYLVPVIYAAVLTYFPDPRECWLQMIAAGLYVTVLTSMSCNVLQNVCIVGISFVFLAFCSVQLGEQMEPMKEKEDGVYRTTRRYVKEHVIQKAEETWNAWSADRQTRKEAQTKKEEQKEESEKEEQKTQAKIPQTEQNMIPEETGMDSSGGMEDLRELGSFVPRKGVLFTVTQEEMPTDTIYVSEKYGKEYDGGSWREGSATDPASVYLQYPSSLKQLRKLCNELQEADSFEEAERFVEETLKRQAVYDVNPGSTPSGEDFAEYFLFENHKGFCVHFATAATLMYRMLGIPARFAEGYAIPASAFSQQENGQYVAEVEGSMGHAWCEVWQEDTGWKVEDHTGAASALENVERARASSDTWQQIRKALFQCLKVIGVILLMFALIILQAWIRTVRKRKRCRTGSIDARIRFVYQSLYEVAEFLHPYGEDPFSMQGKEAVKKSLPELEEADLNWMYDTMMRTMFYKGCDIRDGEQMYRLYGQCRKKVKQGLNAWKKLQWNVIKCFP